MGHKKVERIDPLTKKMAPFGVDSHAHLDDEAFDTDRQDILDRASQVGLAQIVNIFLDPITFSLKKTFFAEYPFVYFALGIHPCDGMKVTEQTFESLEQAFSDEPRLVAMGEIGLDYYWKECAKEIQLDLFSRQLELARTLEKPVIIHCREAEDDCIMMLESRNFVGYPLLWHCFGGNKTLAKRILHNGWYISIPGAVTYPANEALREALSCIPPDRLLLETDCPYLSPNPWRGRRNEPAYTVFTCEEIGKALSKSPEEVWKQCGDTARHFFGIPHQNL